MVLDPDGPVVPVFVFASDDLPEHWSRLDEFEGPSYERVVAAVLSDAGASAASIYALRQPSRATGQG